MDKVELLKKLNLGNSVAEYDKNLSDYFINTNYVEELINNNYDIIIFLLNLYGVLFQKYQPIMQKKQ